MRLLLDTHVLIAVGRREFHTLRAEMATAINDHSNALFASAASFWEIAIKTRLGKLDPGMGLHELADYFDSFGFSLLAVDHRHALQEAQPVPATRDPFDRLLLAQCAVEGLRLVTTDRVLAQHKLAWREI
jgi:PIN domain nuclease of toxin-antitoxin system